MKHECVPALAGTTELRAPSSQRTTANQRGVENLRNRATTLAKAAPARHFHSPMSEIPSGAGSDMKVTVERAELLKSLGHVHRVVERRNTIPILANVLIRAERSKLAFKATDLDLEITETHPRRSLARAARPRCRRTCSTRSCASCPRARRSCSKPPATAPCSRSAPAARASPCRLCRKAIFPISPPAR